MKIINKEQLPSTQEIKQLAKDWIAYYEIVDDSRKNTREFRKAIESGTHPLSYVYDAAHHYINRWPDAAWDFINELLLQAPSEEVLAHIAAGPLEDLLTHHPYTVIDCVEKRAKKDPKFRMCLTEVWQNKIPKDVWQRIVVACGNSPRL